MPSLCLPGHPDIDHLKGQARVLQRQVRSGDAAAVAAVRQHHPRREVAGEPAGFRLTDAQLVLARQYGFPSWAALRRHVAIVEEHGRWPHQVALVADGVGDRADQILRLGCLVYGGDDLGHHARARAMADAWPELASSSIWAAAAVGDAVFVRRFLEDHPSLANRPGGPFDWVPMLYLTYSRLDNGAPGGHPPAAASVLLDAGADPNAGYLWDGTYPFTALTGAFGGGEDKGNQPPHRHALALARLLLEAGADPNDSQALYNRQFDPDVSHLRLLIEFGLGSDRNGPWHARLNSSQGTPAQLLEDQLSVAASENRPEWARLALAAGADPNGRGTAHPVHKGLTPHELAVRRGNREVAEILLAAGATPAPLDPVEAFLAALMADAGPLELEALLASRPGVAAEAVARRPTAIIEAAELGRSNVIHALTRVGFDINVLARTTPLHQAAYAGNVEVVRTLLRLGADPNIKDRSYGTPPLRWAEHARRDAVIELLREVTDVPPSHADAPEPDFGPPEH